jgi:hypothetical protein
MRTTGRTRWLLASLALVTFGCRSSSTAPLTTGLTGIITRGPITPVCMVNQSCDAPFSAHFSVRQGSRTVATFQSDSTGAFVVLLAPGNYTVVAGNDAPVISPSSQSKPVTVGPSGLTYVQLSFDTGIR